MPSQPKSKIKTRRSTRLNSSRNNDQNNNDQNANVTSSGNGNLREDQGAIQVSTDDADLEEENAKLHHFFENHENSSGT